MEADMDMHELKRRERWAELADTLAQADRNNQARARYRRTLCFWFNPRQVAIDPTVAVATPEAYSPPSAFGVVTGPAGSTAASRPAAALPAPHSGSPVPGRPHL
jgi:hypothetical protein